MFVFMAGFLLDVGIHTLEWQLFSIRKTSEMVVGSITSGFSVWCLLALLFERAGDMIIHLNLCLV